MKTIITRKKSLTRTFILTAAALSLLLSAPAVFAQDYGQQGQQQQGQQQQGQDYGGQGQDYGQQQQQQTDFSDEELKQFASAQEDIEDIRADYSKELRNTQDSEKAQSLQSKYQDKMIEAIQGEGLSVEKYNTIIQAVSTDTELKEKVEELK
ncbi:MAG: DUF4168 domain-containing protein [Desulfobacterales bacterium]